MNTNSLRGMLLVSLLVPLSYGMLYAQTTTQPAPTAEPATTQPAEPITLVKGPYLQAMRPDGLTICLEPSRDTTGRIVIQNADGAKAAEAAFEALADKSTRIPLGGLKPNESYQYAVYLEGATRPAFTSTFRTFPPVGHLPVDFLVTGDSRTNPNTWHHLSEALRKTGIPIVLHSGDFVTAGRAVRTWNAQFFDPARALLASTALYPAVGNHELGGSGPDGYAVFRRMFALPMGKTWYSFDFGGVHFIVLDSTRNDTEGSEQYQWARADLAASKAPWKVAMLHHPWYCAGSHASNVIMRRLYLPLFIETGVDLLVCGHDHNYQKTRPIVQVFAPRSKKPFWQIVSGGGGAPLYPIRRPEVFLDKSFSTNHYLKVSADKDRMLVVALAPDGKELDRLEIPKDAPLEGAVTVEQIELEQMLRDWLLTKPFVFAPDEKTATISSSFTNTLPMPVKLRFECGDTKRFELGTEPTDVQVPPQLAGKPGTTPIRLALRCLDSNVNLSDLTIRMVASYDTKEAGSGKVTDVLVPVILLKAVTPTPAGEMTVDGKLDEPAWSQAQPATGFRETKKQEPEPLGIATTVKAAKDNRNLYLAVTCKLPPEWVDTESEDIVKADNVRLDLATSPTKVITLYVTPGGKTQLIPHAASAKVAVIRNEAGWTLEVAVPLAEFGPVEQVRLGVLRHVSGKVFSLMPYGLPFNYDTASVIPLKAIATTQPAAPR